VLAIRKQNHKHCEESSAESGAAVHLAGRPHRYSLTRTNASRRSLPFLTYPSSILCLRSATAPRVKRVRPWSGQPKTAHWGAPDPPEVAAPTRLLLAAERPGGVAIIVVLDADGASVDLFRHGMGDCQIARPRACLQAVFRVVGEFSHGVEIGVIERLHAGHGPEDLFAHDAHGPIGLEEHGRLDEIPLRADDVAAGRHRCPLFSGRIQHSR